MKELLAVAHNLHNKFKPFAPMVTRSIISFMGVLLSVHIQKLGTKGRLSIPSDFSKLPVQQTVALYTSCKVLGLIKFDLSARIALSVDLINQCKFQDEITLVDRGQESLKTATDNGVKDAA